MRPCHVLLCLFFLPADSLPNGIIALSEGLAAPCNASGVSVKVIASRLSAKSKKDHRVSLHVDDLMNEWRHFSDDVKTHPPVFSAGCPEQNGSDKSGDHKGHGSNMAHRDALERFVRYSPNCVAVIHEYDAFAGSHDAHSAALAAIQHHMMNASLDVLLLGYCYKTHTDHPRVTHNAPYCMHAYAVSKPGAMRLLDVIDPCGIFADAQVAQASNDGRIRLASVNDSLDTTYLKNLFLREGMHNGPFLFDGIFVQAKYDEYPLRLGVREGSVVSCRSHGKELFVLRGNASTLGGHRHNSPHATDEGHPSLHWQPVGSMDNFYKLGVKSKDILVLSDWQFRQHPLVDLSPKSNSSSSSSNGTA